MNEKFLKAKELTEKHDQAHLLAFYNELDDASKESLLDQILSIDFDLMKNLYEQAKAEMEGGTEIKGEITPIGCVEKKNLSAEELAKYDEKGREIMKNGGFAAVTMAGGQGTRLGHNGPKGTYNIGLESNMSLFVDRILHTFLLMIAMSAGMLLAMTILHFITPLRHPKREINA